MNFESWFCFGSSWAHCRWSLLLGRVHSFSISECKTCRRTKCAKDNSLQVFNEYISFDAPVSRSLLNFSLLPSTVFQIFFLKCSKRHVRYSRQPKSLNYWSDLNYKSIHDLAVLVSLLTLHIVVILPKQYLSYLATALIFVSLWMFTLTLTENIDMFVTLYLCALKNIFKVSQNIIITINLFL
jgi:hypothetical protein